MKDSRISMNPNDLVQFLNKPSEEFTRNDILRFCEEKQIKMLNFRYVAEDGRLKTLNFVINSRDYLETVLSQGERVDGSSLFSFIESGSSDLYVIPRYRTAFLNPFATVPTLDIFCSFYNNQGQALESDPYTILHKADQLFSKEAGCRFLALGELEYYVIAPAGGLYPGVNQKGYHASEPFAKYEFIRNEALQMIARAGGNIKYGHSEVGCFTQGESYYEQHEIEFLPCTVEKAAEQLVLAKWILRMLGNKYGVSISYAPKITEGKAGSGLHFHMMLEKEGKNLVADKGKLSDIARKMIAGILDSSDAITAFGNTIPTSYFRLVPNQEAPTRICWGDRNRSVVVRVPLGWSGAEKMVFDANPAESESLHEKGSKQTFEYRVADGSADVFLTLASLIIASLDGIKRPDALELAEQLYVDVNIFKPEHREKMQSLKQLPLCCADSAEALKQKRALFEENHIFPAGFIDSQIKKLQSYNDKGLSEKLFGKQDILKLVEQFLHIG